MDWSGGDSRMEKHALILTTTSDFLWKFERENVKILQQMGYVVHYATNLKEPSYFSEKERLDQLGIQVHPIDIARSPFLFRQNERALRQVLDLIRKYDICLLHCHTPVGGLLGRLAGRRLGPGKLFVIYTAHGFHFYQGAPLSHWLAYYRVERFLAHYTDTLILINEEDAAAARRFRLRKGGKRYLLPGTGLDTQLFILFPRSSGRKTERSWELARRNFFWCR